MSIIDFNRRQLAETFSGQVSESRRFVMNASGASDRAGIVIGGGFEIVEAEYIIGPRILPFFGIELVAGGVGSGTLGAKPFSMSEGTVLVYDEGTEHQFSSSQQRPLKKYFLDLDPRRARQRFRKLLPPVGIIRLSQWSDLQRLWNEMIHHGSRGDLGSQAICDALLNVLLLQLLRAAALPSDATLAFVSYRKVCTVIDTMPLRLRTLDDVAAEVRLDGAYICRLFRRFDTQSPYQRLLDRRMALAAAELYRSGSTVREIAMRFGYNDAFAFSRAFKRVTGSPPSKFRVSEPKGA